MNYTGLFLLLFMMASCSKQNISGTKVSVQGNISYLALGDSYTIGEGLELNASFPWQLVTKLGSEGLDIAAPRIVARTGWTTDELATAIKQENITSNFTIVTLLIGVNNQFRGYPQDSYRKEFKELLQKAITIAGGNKNNVFVISIPDWGVTPFAETSGRDVTTISKEIDAFNMINKQEAAALAISYIDITPTSRMAFTDLSFLANDGLHPSAIQYAQWIAQLAPAIKKVLQVGE